MCRLIPVLFASLLPLSLSAQQAQQIPWTTIGVPSGDSLTVKIPASFDHWVVGVNVSAGTPEKMEVVDATFRNFWPKSPASKNAPYFPITAHSVQNISTSANTVSLSGGGQTLIVYINLANNRSISISAGSNQPVTATVTAGLVVADGVVKGSAPVSEASVFSQGMVAFEASAGTTPKPVQSRNGVAQVTDSKYLQSHLTHYVDFPANAGTGQIGLARLQVSIGTDGRVQGVSCGPNLPVTGLACEDIKAVVTQWAFDPFSVNGQVSPVVARVMLFATQAGLTSSLSPSFRAGEQ